QIFSCLRGKGLLLGAELDKAWQGKAKQLTNLAAEEGLIALIAGPDVLRFAPALNIEFADIDEGLVRLESAIMRFVG
ncbi:aminotransferase class III-fold pyridoxal phosphate-dependent enzyme, partial [Enterobacter hormaechei]|nr:aminotransferase class III-fold pyridoxal phosphate-dependent enzyme [Enterobacter hormaechei]